MNLKIQNNWVIYFSSPSNDTNWKNWEKVKKGKITCKKINLSLKIEECSWSAGDAIRVSSRCDLKAETSDSAKIPSLQRPIKLRIWWKDSCCHLRLSDCCFDNLCSAAAIAGNRLFLKGNGRMVLQREVIESWSEL